MTALKLLPANENRDVGPWSSDDFDVVLVDTGKKIGPHFPPDRGARESERLVWELLRGEGPPAVLWQCREQGRGEAGFAECWRSAT